MITFVELKKRSEPYDKAILLDRILSPERRFITRTILCYLFWLSLIVVLFANFTLLNQLLPENIASFLIEFANKFYGLSFILGSLYAWMFIVEFFYASFYYKENVLISFELARLIENGDSKDLTKSFCYTSVGQEIFLRLGITGKEIVDFLKNRQNRVTSASLNLEKSVDPHKMFSFYQFAEALYDSDAELREFLGLHGIDRTIFAETSHWTGHNLWHSQNEKRWWSMDNLIRIPSVGKNWAFGKIFYLEKHGHSIYFDSTYQRTKNRYKVYSQDVSRVEEILIRSTSSNVLLSSPTIEMGMNICSALGRMIALGQIHPLLENQRVFVLDMVGMLDVSKELAGFENELAKTLNQAVSAGNVILVVPHFGKFLELAGERGSDAFSIIEQFLSSYRTHLIALTDKSSFHQTIETNRNILQYFEKIEVEDVNDSEAMQILTLESLRIENKTGLLFLYPALAKILESAKRFFSEEILSDKLIDLLEAVTNKVLMDGRAVVSEGDVVAVVSLQTGIPLGAVGDEEKAKLSALEEILHKRIIGQNLAIEAISKAVRRSRAGIQNPKRPFGSFMFLGPTGVGKTETAKALAEAFFNDENKFVRFDMTEFNSPDAIMKLIGGYQGKPGVLAVSLREQQYGVLLLDEFEKADKEVHNLFLQILDEGQFKDSRGEMINVRNYIIIATSNAGSDLIYESANQACAKSTRSITDEIIKREIFKPELLNRFDGIIMFHPLNPDHLREVARLMLVKLNERLLQKGLKVEFNNELLQYLVEIGSNPKFGAREMNRVIQNVIESEIADALISGRIKKGQIIHFKIDGDKVSIDQSINPSV